MDSKCNILPTAETMKYEDEAFEIIIQQIEGGTISFFLILICCLNFRVRDSDSERNLYPSREFYKTEIERLLTEQTQIREANQKLKKNHNALQTEFQTQFCSRKLSDQNL